MSMCVRKYTVLCIPLGVPGYMVGWSYPASAWLLQESPPLFSTAVWASLSQCLYHKLLCLHWSTRSHILPLKESIIKKNKASLLTLPVSPKCSTLQSNTLQFYKSYLSAGTTVLLLNIMVVTSHSEKQIALYIANRQYFPYV